MSKIPVKALYDNCEMMLAEKWGYIYGTAGVKCTQAVIDQSIERFPQNADMTRRYGPQWLGRMVTDCSGVMAYIWKQFGLKIPHGSSSMVAQKYIVDCGDTPHPGWAALVDPTPDTPDNNHIGIVAEDGKHVYEARGTAYGFVYSPLDKRFTKFGRFKDVDYGEVIPMPDQGVLYQAKVTTESGSLRLRSKPDATSTILTNIPKGTILDVYGDENGWSSTIYNGMAGYCSNQYLTRLDGQPNTSIWAVIVPCETQEEAEMLASHFTDAIVAEQDE